MSKFENAIRRTGADVSDRTKEAVLDVAGTMGMAKLWFEYNGLDYTASDLLTFVNMVGMEREYIASKQPE